MEESTSSFLNKCFFQYLSVDASSAAYTYPPWNSYYFDIAFSFKVIKITSDFTPQKYYMPALSLFKRVIMFIERICITQC